MTKAPKGKQPLGPTDRMVKLVCVADIKPEPMSWLWRHWLPTGTLTILAGEGGTAKSTVAFSLAATLTTGGDWPDGTSCANKGNVVIWSGEDSANKTITPRLIAAGVDQTRCHIIKSSVTQAGVETPFDPAFDMASLHDAVEQLGGASLLIIDPLVSAISGDMHRANDVRRSLQPVVDFAEAQNCAVIGITHFSKGSAKSAPQDRVLGSQAFAALARMVLVTAKGEDGKKRRIARAKSNIAPDGGGFSYRVDLVPMPNNIEATLVVWEEHLEGTARDILGQAETINHDNDNKHHELKQLLVDLLTSAGGRMPSTLIQTQVEAAGYSWHTAKRAKAAAGIYAQKEGKDGPWVWALNM